jgi:ferrous iron transport protein A
MTTIDTPDTANFRPIPEAIPLDSLALGSRCTVIAVDETSESLLRLMEMGLIPGAQVVLERTAPLRSPFSVRLSGCTLAVRAEDARRVMVQPIIDTEGAARS